MADPGETWKDLAIFGYNDKLELKEAISQAEIDEEIPTDTEVHEESEEEDLSFESDSEEGDEEQEEKKEGGEIDLSQFNEEKLRKALAAAQFTKPWRCVLYISK